MAVGRERMWRYIARFVSLSIIPDMELLSSTSGVYNDFLREWAIKSFHTHREELVIPTMISMARKNRSEISIYTMEIMR